MPRVRREQVRLEAAEMFAGRIAPVEVAERLRVSTKSAYQWRRCWRASGVAALASKGAGGARCRLSAARLERPAVALEAAASAWIVFEVEAGQNLCPPRARTWARRGHSLLHAPIIVIWDDLNTHVSAQMRSFAQGPQ